MKMSLHLWNQVAKTDPDYTKDYKGAGGFSGTAINSTYQVRKATELFGPIGIGWGYNIVESKYTDGHAIAGKDDSGKPFIHDNITTKLHTLHLKLWYMHEGKRGEVEHFGHTPFVFVNKFGVQMENEPEKKSLTDAIGKCLSMLGFSADIFMGEYDDINYKEQLRVESDIKKAENKETEEQIKRDELTDYVTRHIDTLAGATAANEANGIGKTALRHLERQKKIPALSSIAERGITAISRKLTEKLEQLKNETV
jgi:hypothetical protein